MASEMSSTLQTAQIIYVIGGPGAGKGTQCTRLARDLNVVHVSVGDLLRAEQHQPLSERAEAIRKHYHEGKHLDDHIYVDVLREHIALQIQNGRTNFIVDGFPRNICQTGYFERRVDATIKAILFFSCPEDLMLTRVLHRGHTSGRADDNELDFKKRYRRFMDRAEVVLEFYRGAGMLTEINSNRPVEEVYSEVRSIVQEIFALGSRD